MSAVERRPRRYRRLIGFIAGAALLAAAAFAISQNSAQFDQAIGAAARASWWLIALAIALPIVNWFIMSVSFWMLMRRHGRISLPEMSCLIGTAWLLNYLPMRPGLLGRVAYHKAVNKIPVAKSISVTVLSLLCAGVAIGILLGGCIACAAGGASARTEVLVLVILPVMLALTATGLCARMNGPWWVAATISFRLIDLLVWAARYMVVFAIIGHPLSLTAGAAIAAIGQIAMLVPFVGNGMGLREWAVGLVSSALPPGVVSASGKLTTAIGLLADLVNRAAELSVAVPIGLASAAFLSRRHAQVKVPQVDAAQL